MSVDVLIGIGIFVSLGAGFVWGVVTGYRSLESEQRRKPSAWLGDDPPRSWPDDTERRRRRGDA